MIMVIMLSNEGNTLVNPFALLEAVPNPPAKINIKEGSRVFSIMNS